MIHMKYEIKILKVGFGNKKHTKECPLKSYFPWKIIKKENICNLFLLQFWTAFSWLTNIGKIFKEKVGKESNWLPLEKLVACLSYIDKVRGFVHLSSCLFCNPRLWYVQYVSMGTDAHSLKATVSKLFCFQFEKVSTLNGKNLLLVERICSHREQILSF